MGGRLRACLSFAVGLAAAGFFAEAGSPARAQAPEQTAAPAAAPEPAPAEAEDEGPSIRDSSVGYIDPAIPANQFRLRYDSSYDNNRPTRAEFFWARTGPAGPGLPLPERRVDYQDVSPYLEATLNRRFSVFAEVPVRFLNPAINANTGGLADMNGGFKWAFLVQPGRVVTFQFRTYVPTGDVHSGLSNGHASVEPGLLLYQRLGESFGLESELRYWAPVGGTNFAGDVVRYGAGLWYDVYRTETASVRPVAEFVGWTVLGGKESVFVAPGEAFVQSAAGDTIVNVKLGVRSYLGAHTSLYAGYGRALTGDVWYKNTFRLEMRLVY